MFLHAPNGFFCHRCSAVYSSPNLAFSLSLFFQSPLTASKLQAATDILACLPTACPCSDQVEGQAPSDVTTATTGTLYHPQNFDTTTVVKKEGVALGDLASELAALEA